MFDYEKHRTEAENPRIHARAVFVLGLRRSGTSIVRQCLNAHSKVDLLFEPRDLWWSVTQGHLPRFRSCSSAQLPAKDFFNFIDSHRGDQDDVQCGAKFAFEPGITAMYWRHIELRFRSPRFIFVTRNAEDTYASYCAMDHDSVQGVTNRSAFSSIREQLYESFCDFQDQFPARCAFVEYEKLVSDKKLPGKVWHMLGLEPVDVSGLIHAPRNTQGMCHVA